MVLLLCVIRMLLLIGGVDMNPGPNGYQDVMEGILTRVKDMDEKLGNKLNGMEKELMVIKEDLKNEVQVTRLEMREVKRRVEAWENKYRRFDLVIAGVKERNGVWPMQEIKRCWKKNLDWYYRAGRLVKNSELEEQEDQDR